MIRHLECGIEPKVIRHLKCELERMDYLGNAMTYDELVKSAQKVDFNAEAARKLREEILQLNKQFDEEAIKRVVTADVLAITCNL